MEFCLNFLRRINEQTRPEKYYAYYEEEIMLNNLRLGETVEDMFFVYRIKTDYPKCPLCGSSIFPGDASLSRRNNKTELCVNYGFRESMEDLAGMRGN